MLSHDVTSTQTTFAASQALMSIYEEFVSLFKITLASAKNLQVTEAFSAAVSKLPQNYDEQAYKNFVDIYGTHFISTGVMGGKASLRVFVDQFYYGENDDQQIESNTRLMFKMFQAGSSSGCNQTYQQFNSESFGEFVLMGGDYEVMKASDYDSWYNTIKCDPTLISYQLVDITDLIDNPVIQHNLASYIAFYEQQNTPDEIEWAGYVPKLSSIGQVSNNVLFSGPSSYYDEKNWSTFWSDYYKYKSPLNAFNITWTPTVSPPSNVQVRTPNEPYLCPTNYHVYPGDIGNGHFLDCLFPYFVTGFENVGEYYNGYMICSTVCYDTA